MGRSAVKNIQNLCKGLQMPCHASWLPVDERRVFSGIWKSLINTSTGQLGPACSQVGQPTSFSRLSRTPSELALQQIIDRDCLDGRIDIPEDDDSQQKTYDRITGSPQPVQIPTRAGFTHEQHDGCAAIQRRNRQQIERAEKQIE